MLSLGPVWLCAQQQPPPAKPAADSGPIHVEVIEGNGAINSIRLHRAHDPVVRVTDAAGKPIAGANVTFMLPASGPSLVFPDGGYTTTIQTDDQGTGAARGLRPNSVPGPFEIRVIASAHGSQAVATLSETNAEPEVRTSHTKLYVILAAVAGAAAGGAVLAARGGGANSTSTSTGGGSPTGSISAGSPSFGPPH